MAPKFVRSGLSLLPDDTAHASVEVGVDGSGLATSRKECR